MKNIVVFTYAFNHAKTQNGLIKLVTNGIIPRLVVAQESKPLAPNPDSLQIAPKLHQSLGNWQRLLEVLRIPHLIADHDSQSAHNAIVQHKCDLGIILGSRILKPETIQKVKGGIINAHPGLLPINRGLDNLKKAILLDIDPAVTVHLIDERIDLGRMLFIKKVPLFENDTFHSVFLRHQTMELDGITEAVELLRENKITPTPIQFHEYSEKLGDKFDVTVKSKFRYWLKKRL